MIFDYKATGLPIVDIIEPVKTNLLQHNTLIVNAPAGAGKSTVLPLAIYNEPWLKGKSVIMLEPRRLAAIGIAMRMSGLLGQPVGKTVGYQIRFDNRTESQTKIKILTEGILTRLLLSDNSLNNVGMVIFDEFHERNLFADQALALCRELQSVLRPDLRIIVMSATLDMPKLSKLLNAPVVNCEGKIFPVTINYANNYVNDIMFLPEMVCKTVVGAVKNNPGDTLVFMPGEAEIKKTTDILKNTLTDFEIHPLYGKLPYNLQLKAILPNTNGKRKIVLATSIAETSLTIENIKIVIDTGYRRVSRFDPCTGLSRLETVLISKDSADQRAGRAGRLSPGVCYRMWTNATHNQLLNHRIPEIAESDLTSLVLTLAEWGTTNIDELTWLTQPPKTAVDKARETLHHINALQNNIITLHGKQINKMPCHPRIAHLLLMAQKHNQIELAADLAAILEERDPMPNEQSIDINLRIIELRKQRAHNNIKRSMAQIHKISASYHKMFNISPSNNTFDPYQTGILLVYAYPERIASSRPGNNAQYQLSNGSYAMFSHKDDLSAEPWLAVASIDARDNIGKIFMASPLNPKDLAFLVAENHKVTWDIRKGGLVATTDLRIGSIVLQSKPLTSIDQNQKIAAITDAIKKDGKALLNFDEKVEMWQNRVLSLRAWNTNQNWPNVNTDFLLDTNHTWLAPFLVDAKTNDDLKKINLLKILPGLLTNSQLISIDKLAPNYIQVPSGSKIKIQYFANGTQPVLAVRLQEIFGLTGTPKINDGKIPLLIHLLSPGFKPVQITSDLKSFWENTYFEIKKQLRIKYPKHSWPDNPLIAKPLKGIIKK